MNLSDSDKVNILINFYNQVYQETIRYRDLEIKLTVIIVALFAGLITSIYQFQEQLQFLYIKRILLIFSILTASYGSWFIWFCHRQFITNRNRIKKCEKIFKFHHKNIYEKDSFLPKDYSKPVKNSHALKYPILFLILIIVMTIFTSYMIISL